MKRHPSGPEALKQIHDDLAREASAKGDSAYLVSAIERMADLLAAGDYIGAVRLLKSLSVEAQLAYWSGIAAGAIRERDELRAELAKYAAVPRSTRAGKANVIRFPTESRT